MNTYLTTTYRDRERVKSLGARWDAERKRWFVPAGVSLGAFSAWLPSTESSSELQTAEQVPLSGTGDLSNVTGVSLSVLLNGIADMLSVAYRAGVWTVVEVSRVDIRGAGHVYLELAERDPRGNALAQARAMIWSRTASQLLPEFERATGVVLAAGIKLLVRAKPTMHAVYGLSLEIDAINPDFTLGDLAARKREIRERLKAEGLFDGNRQLPSPWDYGAVLVVAPEAAAGLGDFRAESERLEQHGVCCFTYATCRFQGEGAADAIRNTLDTALAEWRRSCPDPDAICVIRGGGAANDLAWLNDYALARWICECDVPVLTGIGHERDETILDEVAHCAYDTPSKAIGGIEVVIRKRADEAKAVFSGLVRGALVHIQRARSTCQQLDSVVRSEAGNQLQKARRQNEQQLAALRLLAVQRVGQASELVARLRQSVEHDSGAMIAKARQQSQALMGEVKVLAERAVLLGSAASAQQHHSILQRSQSLLQAAKDSSAQALQAVAQEASRTVVVARERAESLMREVTGQGPDKALLRGFAIALSDGVVLTSADHLRHAGGTSLALQFHDGEVRINKAEQQ